MSPRGLCSLGYGVSMGLVSLGLGVPPLVLGVGAQQRLVREEQLTAPTLDAARGQNLLPGWAGRMGLAWLCPRWLVM